MGVANGTLPNFLTTPPSVPGASTTRSPKEEEENSKVLLPVYSKESTVISNLRHFTSYQIEIHACNHPTDNTRCSMAAYVSARTMPEGTSPLTPAAENGKPLNTVAVFSALYLELNRETVAL